ncbi:hypothetical protein [Sphingomonas xinjiangensis]|uniref:Uncharacterized protein n=1 Tax=Sphingomonas xinjiangensis TaxID=643568 RepID=A0A840YNZ3_9SPHN|nr:hypothetical protein [Sphingomonas xinjiangensis]MBB5709362.1 hypothetical protein [Sphingomonas xinjiangensis]
MNLKKLLGKVVKAAKKNPEFALVVAGVIAPGLVRKAAPIIAKAKVVREVVR